MQYSQPESLSPRRTIPEQKIHEIGTLHDLDLKDVNDSCPRVYEPRMVTAPLRFYEHQSEQKIQRASEARSNSEPTLYDKVFHSIRQGNDPKEISIPDHRVAKDIVFYKVVTCNEVLRWNSWIRYDDFASLHHRLEELAGSLDTELPPLPAKFPKVFVNHHSKEFIEHRRARLQFYLRKLNANSVMRYSEDFLSFLLPSRQDEDDFLEEKFDGTGTWGSSEEDTLPQGRRKGKGTWASSSEDEMRISRPLHGMLPLALLMPSDRVDEPSIPSIPLVQLNK